MRKSIAADLAKLEQELSYKTTGYDGTLASGKTWYGVHNKINIFSFFWGIIFCSCLIQILLHQISAFDYSPLFVMAVKRGWRRGMKVWTIKQKLKMSGPSRPMHLNRCNQPMRLNRRNHHRWSHISVAVAQVARICFSRYFYYFHKISLGFVKGYKYP